jgi:UDP-N-acetylglucosamine 2-epimerase (non-hydrolysing)
MKDMQNLTSETIPHSSPDSTRRIKALCVFGTRPDAVKMAPIVKELKRNPERFDTRVVVTGQHREQLDQVLRVFEITPDRDLAIMQHGQTLAQITTRALSGLDDAISEERPDVVLAQGDTSTTFVASLAAFYHKIPFGHVEAGLRTDNLYDPFPEEMNRRLTGVIARFHFAPTEQSRENLLREHVPAEHIWVTGNTGIDALLSIAAKPYEFEDPQIRALMDSPNRMVLITAHRRENLGAPLTDICNAVARLAEEFTDCDFVYAIHKNPAVREVARPLLEDRPRIHLIEPPDYAPFVKLMQRSSLILTDSGGVQEEAPSLGVPVLVLRRTTERPEGITAGVAKLVGTDTETVVAESRVLLTNEAAHGQMARAMNPYGDGQAAMHIRQALEESLK